MAELGDMTFKASDLAKDLTVNVRITGMRRFRFRLAIARWLIWLACKVAGCGLHVEDEEITAV